jgi:peptidoglycan/LPS O-acetylase OafA/YrhL
MRAIAVLSVVFFHLRKGLLPGGYLGVDVFFVLSGYLITGIIWREACEHRFSIVRFYDRRIRRIMPALLLLLAAVTAAAVAVLLPSDLIGFGKSLLATLVFAANVYFWRDTDYFSAAAGQKPLLHIWSLGIEEQFYILFPLILVLVARYLPRRALAVVGGLSLASLGANMLAIHVGGALPAFFLLPARAWELGAGALLALPPLSQVSHARGARWFAASGLLLIVIGMLHPVDSIWWLPAAVPAVLGTVLLLLAGNRAETVITRALRLKPLVFVGLISYSLYLWHWPIIVFSQYYLVRPLTAVEGSLALAAMTACAALSWWFIERPFRGKRIPILTVRLAAAGGMLLLAAAAAVILRTHGLPGRLGAEAAAINQAVDTNYRCPISAYLAFGRSRACAMHLPTRNPADAEVVLLGNSHAQMYAPVWESILAERGVNGLLVPLNGCLPTVQTNISPECLAAARANLAQVLKLPGARTVIIGLTWGSDVAGLLPAIDDLIERLRAAGKQVVLIGPIAEPGWDVASTISRRLAFGHPIDRPLTLPTSEFMRRFGPAIAHFENRGDVRFVRPDRVQCPAELCFYVLDGHSLFSDSNHLAAAELPRFQAAFASALAP